MTLTKKFEKTSGTVKRSEPPDADEEMLFMRTVRDMNLSKLVADDVRCNWKISIFIFQ
jgi:hypothetical protein